MMTNPAGRIATLSVRTRIDARVRTLLSVGLPVAGLCAGIAFASFSGAAGPAAAADCEATPNAGIDWSGCSKANLMLPSSTLTDAVLAGANLSATDLGGSDLGGANLEKATLIRASLSGASAEKANFARIEAYRSNLSGIKAAGASFAGAELQRTNLTEADLTGADFSKAELSRVNFAKSNITGTRFSLANLARAKLTGATFKGPIAFDEAFLYLTRIEGLDLSAATGLKQEQVALACGDAKTKLPPGLTPPTNWPCKHD
ncbi:pentapeptide repeat-containing protein [Rhizobium sp. Leaf341]|uniref:pentapeptide repeat-containing protein n=1 Tax=Rhizobium sp. Leaf341 TaxID=1736344 RepID=UPI001FCD2214|nr:pentapeptide repeat-containing protein [Rhizobium sp. Leaf341]